MELRQRTELRRIMAPELRQSLKILALPLTDVQQLIEEEMLNNPVLEEFQPDGKLKTAESLDKILESLPPSDEPGEKPLSEAPSADQKVDFAQTLSSKDASLQDVLLRQLGMFVDTAEELCIGQEIIGNIDENGYLQASLDEISAACHASPDQAEKMLKLIQQFEPAGIAARSIPECLLIQLRFLNENDPLLGRIIESHLDDVAKKNYSRIAKTLGEPLEKIEPLIHKITKLDPKPGRNFSAEHIQQIIPDILIEEAEDGQLKITINNERVPRLIINKSYKEMLKKDNLDPQTREFIANKLRSALELIRSLAKRQSTLRRVIEAIVEVQREALLEDLSFLKPLTFSDIAGKIGLHETTVCRVCMNKYAQTPCGVVALKDFFPSRLKEKDLNGESVSSEKIKGLILDRIEAEDKKHPLSDEDIVKLLKEHSNLIVARRTVTKYREELKILSSPYRRIK